MISNNKDLFERTEELIALFEKKNMKAFAQDLKNAMSSSTLPGEVLGEMRLTMEKIARTKDLSDKDICAKIEQSLQYLNKVL